MNTLSTLALSATLLAALFFITWRIAKKIDNFSIVDVTWSYAFAPTAITYAILCDGWLARRAAIACIISLWSLRLGTYLFQRVFVHHPKVDPRYATLENRWQPDPQRAFLIFFLSQGLLVWLLMLPVYFISTNPAEAFHPFELAGITLWLTGLIGEAIADAQLKGFKASSADALAVCKRGLWRYSRHPNYFFQSLLWWGLFLIAIPVSWGWLTIVAPLAMLYFILRVTGIPLTEELALKKRGDSYRVYQRTTRPFIPLPKSTNHEPC